MTTDPSVLQARRNATPLRIGRYLAPKLWPGEEFRISPWMLVTEARIMDAVRDKARRFLKFNAPPQITKTTLVEVFTSMWILGHWPNTRIGLIGYNDELAQESGSLVRDCFVNWGPELFGLSVDPNVDAKKMWRLAGHRGGMLSVGIGSTITGKPMDVVIIGDLLKGIEEASSPTILNKHWLEWQGAIRARQARTYLMAGTRFAEGDLHGRIDAQQADPDYQGERWETLVFPAIAEPDRLDPTGNDPAWRDILGRRKGEPLQCRFSEPGEELEENWPNSHFYITERSTEDKFTWSCVYQQNPRSRTGGMFPESKWGYYDPADLPPLMSMRRVWDLAATEGGGDWSVGTKLAKTNEGDILILDVERFRKSGSDAKAHVEVIAAVDGLACPIMIERERSGAGKTILDFYTKALGLYTVEPAIPDGSKDDRARPYSILQQGGHVLLPRHPDGSTPDWVPLFIDEHSSVMGDGRRGHHDDMVDTAAYGVNAMMGSDVTIVSIPGHTFHVDRGVINTLVDV